MSQRTKDIGVLRILLAIHHWQVLMSFFLESLLLAVLGGLLGCAHRLAVPRFHGLEHRG